MTMTTITGMTMVMTMAAATIMAKAMITSS
jgi:hypothetical protein